MSTKIEIEQKANEELTRWVNDETPLNADNMNVLLNGIRDNLKSITELSEQSGKTKNLLKIKYNQLDDGVSREQNKSFNGSSNIEVDLTNIGVSLNTAEDTGMEFVNNKLQWNNKELIEDLFIILDGGNYTDLIERENITN